MGNGAEKILEILSGMGISVSGVFASDDFVRGQSFRGFTVEKLSDIEERERDFIIVVAFGTALPEIIGRICDIALKHTVIMPDIPVSGDTLFDDEFFLKHIAEFETVYELFEDDYSRALFENVINFKISGDIKYLLENSVNFAEIFRAIGLCDTEIYADCGAYTGDTVKIFAETAGSYRRIDAFEPSAKTFSKLQKNVASFRAVNCYNAAVWDRDGYGFIDGTDNRNSNLFGVDKQAVCGAETAGTQTAGAQAAGAQTDGAQTAGAGHTKSLTPVKTVRLDSVSADATLIKLDVEGAEMQALSGIDFTRKPKIICAVYHRSEDLFAIPLFLKQFGYRFKLRRIHCLPAWDIFLIAD
jgi:FkbM family methyltransferase